MKCMIRNKTPFYYANLQESKPIEDEYGNITGETEIIYENPTRFKANISAAAGKAEAEFFGESIPYDKTIVLDKFAPHIDEYTVLWIDTLPEIAEDGTTKTPYDYIVKKVAKNLNVTTLAVKKVSVSINENYSEPGRD